MSARSKAQQRLMAQAYSLKKGDLDPKDISPEYRDEIKDLAQGMTQKQLHDFAATKHKGLPDKVKKKDEGMATPSNVNGMGAVSFPGEPGDLTSFSAQRTGSGDIPATRRRLKTKKDMKIVKMFEEFVLNESSKYGYELVGRSIQEILDAKNLVDNKFDFSMILVDKSEHKVGRNVSVYVDLMYTDERFISKMVREFNDFIDREDFLLSYNYSTKKWSAKYPSKKVLEDCTDSINSKFLKDNCMLVLDGPNISLQPVPGIVVRKINDAIDSINPEMRIVKTA
jgi:hypothetical protein